MRPAGRVPASTDGVATRPRLPRAARGLSHSHTDGVSAAWLHEDAIDANLKFRKLQKQTLSQHLREGKIPIIIAARFSGVAEKAGWSNAVASKIRRAQGAFARPLRLVE